MKNIKILIADDEEILRITLKDILTREGFKITVAEDGEKAISEIESNFFDIALVDLKMPYVNGVEVLKVIKDKSPDTIVIMITGYGTIENAVECMKLGAYDYITKPFLADDVVLTIKKALDFKATKDENIYLHEKLEEKYKFGRLVGKSKQMQEVFNLIKIVSQNDSNVVIEGESGTGKELVASAIHYNSPRKNNPLIKINCSVFPETLLESELFGYEKGAFTGAIKRKLGRFELANGGTLFLDDVDDISPHVQVKLLRVIQEREFERIGGEETIKVDVRIISATKKNLFKLVQEGKFREDLYYRLQVVPIYLPPLRERKEDIPLLIEHFISRFQQRMKKKIEPFDNEVMRVFLDYPWTGNVRQLENTIEYLFTIAKGEKIHLSDLPSFLFEGKSTEDKREDTLKNIRDLKNETEKEYIVSVLKQVNYKKGKAAKILGVSRKTLWEKMKKYDIE